MKVCNDTDKELKLRCADEVAAFGAWVGGHCCTKDYAQARGLSGEQQTKGGYKVVLAYSNCNFKKDYYVPSWGPDGDLWGPNGMCKCHWEQ